MLGTDRDLGRLSRSGLRLLRLPRLRWQGVVRRLGAVPDVPAEADGEPARLRGRREGAWRQRVGDNACVRRAHPSHGSHLEVEGSHQVLHERTDLVLLPPPRCVGRLQPGDHVHHVPEPVAQDPLLRLELHDEVLHVVQGALRLNAVLGLAQDGGDLGLGHDHPARGAGRQRRMRQGGARREGVRAGGEEGEECESEHHDGSGVGVVKIGGGGAEVEVDAEMDAEMVAETDAESEFACSTALCVPFVAPCVACRVIGDRPGAREHTHPSCDFLSNVLPAKTVKNSQNSFSIIGDC